MFSALNIYTYMYTLAANRIYFILDMYFPSRKTYDVRLESTCRFPHSIVRGIIGVMGAVFIGIGLSLQEYILFLTTVCVVTYGHILPYLRSVLSTPVACVRVIDRDPYLP